MRMSGQNDKITYKGISAWHDYMVKQYRFGKPTNIEQGYESAGSVPSDDPATPALGLRYANTSFGQGVQVTALQMASAFSSVLNGGTYYQPTLIAGYEDSAGEIKKNKPVVVQTGVVRAQTSKDMLPLLEGVVKKYYGDGFSYMKFPDRYSVGGKTGTAQVAKPNGGGYEDNIFNGTYMGYVGGARPQYAIVVFNIKPHVAGYAGSRAGQPVFADLAHMLINNGYIAPK
jgi:cell division protein FtsI/penicillin-binding protein 2